MASLRSLASCIGISGEFSVVGDFFGYASPPPWNLARASQQGSLPQSLSLLEQMKRLQQPYFNLDVVRVGTDADGALPEQDEQSIDCALQMTRDIYAAIGVGIGRVHRWYGIPLSSDTGYEAIEDDCEAADLVDDYNFTGGGIDTFLVQSWAGNGLGYTPKDRDGVVLTLRGDDFLGFSRTFAHELGHCTGGLDDECEGDENCDRPNNLMCRSGCHNVDSSWTEIEPDQASDIKSGGKLNTACSV
jgi:hypothetical protein